jgi:hypothetical protein
VLSRQSKSETAGTGRCLIPVRYSLHASHAMNKSYRRRIRCERRAPPARWQGPVANQPWPDGRLSPTGQTSSDMICGDRETSGSKPGTVATFRHLAELAGSADPSLARTHFRRIPRACRSLARFWRFRISPEEISLSSPGSGRFAFTFPVSTRRPSEPSGPAEYQRHQIVYLPLLGHLPSFCRMRPRRSPANTPAGLSVSGMR